MRLAAWHFLAKQVIGRIGYVALKQLNLLEILYTACNSLHTLFENCAKTSVVCWTNIVKLATWLTQKLIVNILTL